MKYHESFPTYQDHLIYKIIDSPVRRKILQLLAIEPNYGTRLSSILRLSPPGLHRHLQRLLLFDDDRNQLSIICEDQRIKDYLGWKGAEAILYRIDSKIQTVFSIFPNFIHSRTIELKEGKIETSENSKDNFSPALFGIEFKQASSTNADLLENYFDKIQDLNHQIKVEEEQLISMLNLKNDLLEEINDILMDDNLTSQERIVLKSIFSNGLGSMKMILDLLNAERFTLEDIIGKLKQKGWIKDKEIKISS